MLPQIKEAVWTCGTWSAGTAAFAAILLFHPAYPAEMIFSLLAIVIFCMWIVRRAFGIRWEKLDERDLGIRFKAGMAGASGVVTLVVITCLLLFLKFHPQGSVPAVFLAYLAFGTMATLYFIWTAAIIILYRKDC